jgi:hypothetical protein
LGGGAIIKPISSITRYYLSQSPVGLHAKVSLAGKTRVKKSYFSGNTAIAGAGQ